jgi:hypothetical protein
MYRTLEFELVEPDGAAVATKLLTADGREETPFAYGKTSTLLEA